MPVCGVDAGGTEGGTAAAAAGGVLVPTLAWKMVLLLLVPNGTGFVEATKLMPANALPTDVPNPLSFAGGALKNPP